jgi:hypothetical protein
LESWIAAPITRYEVTVPEQDRNCGVAHYFWRRWPALDEVTSRREQWVFVAGVDGCSAGWIAFKVESPFFSTSIEVVDLQSWLRKRPPHLAFLSIDIPIGLFDPSELSNE